MTDKELIEKLMKLNNWTKSELARQIGFTPANITFILQDKQKLSNTSRKVTEMLLRDSGEQKEEE